MYVSLCVLIFSLSLSLCPSLSPTLSHSLSLSFSVLRYNPEHDTESRLLRHRAVALQDQAHSFFDHELSEDFEKVCGRFSFLEEERGAECVAV